MFEQVNNAIKNQTNRQTNLKNAFLAPDEIEKHCVLTPEAESRLKIAFEKLNLSMRGYHKILKISRTIADLENSEQIEKSHIQEAIMYRTLDRNVEPA